MEGDGVEVQVEAAAVLQPCSRTASSQAAITWGERPARRGKLYSVRKERLGMTFKPAKRARPSSRTWLMTWLCERAEELEGQQRTHGAGSGDRRGAGEAGAAEDAVQVRSRPDRAGTGTTPRSRCGSSGAKVPTVARRRPGPALPAGVGTLSSCRRAGARNPLA